MQVVQITEMDVTIYRMEFQKFHARPCNVQLELDITADQLP